MPSATLSTEGMAAVATRRPLESRVSRRSSFMIAPLGMLQDAERYGIASLLSARVLAITPEAVRIERAGSIEELAADTVVLAVGTRAHNPLQEAASELAIPCQVVGDAATPATVFEATHAAFSAGRSIR